MLVTHRVKNSDNDTVGFIINNKFINNYIIKQNIQNIENIKLLKSGVIRSSKQLPVITYRNLIKQAYFKLKTDSPFERDIEDILNKWRKSGGREVIQLNGPRQCGKTTEIKKFAYKNYEYVIYIDLSDNTGKLFKETVENSKSTTDLSAVLDFMYAYCERANLPKFINNRKTILIIDEIQLDASVYNMIRTLRSKYNIDIVVTGSYLGVVIFNKHKLLDTISLYGNSNKEDYKQLDKLYETYRLIGGYPDVVKEYIKTKDIKKSLRVAGKIIDIFTQESRNYFDTFKSDIIFKSLYSSAFIEMCSNKKGTGTKLVEDVTQIVKTGTKMVVSRDEVSKSLLWITYSKVLGQCDLCIDGDIKNILPARRFYYIDCGVANYIGNTTGIDKATIDGLITETFAYNELYRLYLNTYSLDKVKGSNPNFSTYGQYELDFLIIGADNKIYGIEVKTTSGDPKSLKVYISKGLVDKGILVKNTVGNKGNKIDTIPIWAVGCRFPYN